MLILSALQEPIPLWDFRQADTGSYQLGGQRKAQENDWDDWHDGRFQRLFSDDADEYNGLALIDPAKRAVNSINLFRVSSNFYKWAVLNERPIIKGESDADAEWIQAHAEELFYAIGKAVHYWTIYDRLVLVLESGRLMAVDPRFYFPIRAEWDEELTLGHLLAFPYWQRPAGENPALVPHYRQANRMKQVRFSEGGALGFPAVNEISFWEFWGDREWTGGRVGRRVGGMGARVEGVWAYGEGNSLYCLQASVVRRIMLRDTALNLVMDRNTYPSMAVAASIANQSGYETEPDGRPKLDANQMPIPKSNWDIKGQMWRIANSSDLLPQFIEYKGLASEQHTELANLMTYWHFLTGVPPSALGGDGSGMGESGAARMQLMFTAQAHARNARRIVETLLKEIIPAMGGPAKLTVRWMMDPMESIMTLYQTAIMLHTAGGIDDDELREVFGWEERTPEQRAEAQEALNGMAREMGNAMNGGQQNEPAGPGG